MAAATDVSEEDDAKHVSFNDSSDIADDDDRMFPQIGKTLVVDGGTYNTRIGVSGEKAPLATVDTAKWASIKEQTQQPIVYGTINKWKDIERLWLDLLEEQLKFDTTEHPLILSEPHDISKANREQITEMIFESISSPAFYISPSSLFSLYSTGRTSGCVLDFAYDCSRVVPIYEGYVLQLNSAMVTIGGQHVSSQLATNLEKSSHVSNIKSFDMNVLEDIKRKHCYCYSAVKPNKNVQYKLPDGQRITITAQEALASTEILFKKSNLCNIIYSSIMKCDAQSNKTEMFNNIIVCGGTAKLGGMNDKIKTELNYLMKSNVETKKQYLHIANPENVQLSSWIGASIFSALESFSRALVTIQEYQECGARIVHHKCF
eukprot:103124_1